MKGAATPTSKAVISPLRFSLKHFNPTGVIRCTLPIPFRRRFVSAVENIIG